MPEKIMTKTIQARVTEALYKALEAEAARLGVRLPDVVRMILAQTVAPGANGKAIFNTMQQAGA